MNSETILEKFKLSPTKQTSHFLFLIILFNILLFTCIHILAKQESYYINTSFIIRISALFKFNIIIIILYTGLISFFQNRSITGLFVLVAFLFFILFFIQLITSIIGWQGI